MSRSTKGRRSTTAYNHERRVAGLSPLQVRRKVYDEGKHSPGNDGTRRPGSNRSGR